MDINVLLPIAQTAIEDGLAYSLTVLALYLSYSMLNVCDLSTDSCFTLGAFVGITVACNGHPYLSILVAMGAGIMSGVVTAILQTYMGIDSLLAGIVVNTGLYSIILAITNNVNNVTAFRKATVFTKVKEVLKGTSLYSYSKLIVLAVFVMLAIIFLCFFLKTRLGLAIRATGNNPAMVKSSSINPAIITIIGLGISNALTALSGCLYCQGDSTADINVGVGAVTVCLASLLIGQTFFGKKSIPTRAIGCVIGAIIFRIVYAIALRCDVPTYMLRLISSVIVIIFIFVPYFAKKVPLIKRKLSIRKKGANINA